ncbi:unnamed protein product [Camellia sinensis]
MVGNVVQWTTAWIAAEREVRRESKLLSKVFFIGCGVSQFHESNRDQRWRPARAGALKFNCDASFNSKGATASAAVLLRNSEGRLVDGIATSFRSSSAFAAEAQAVRLAAQLAITRNPEAATIESNNLEVIKLGVSEKVPPWEALAIILDIRQMVRQENLNLRWTNRANNTAAHWTAQACAHNSLPVGWVSNPPMALSEILRIDALPGPLTKMGFLTLFEMASMPILQVLIISTLGAFMATGYLDLLTPLTQKSLNKIVFMVDLIAWWFMPVNLGLTFLLGGMLGWIAVKLLKPKSELEGLIIATCSAGNLGGLMLIIVPAICREDSSPFGDHKICSSVGLSYASFSMALGNIYIWTYTYQLVRSSALKCKAIVQVPNKDLAANVKTHLLLEGQVQQHVTPSTISTQEDTDNQAVIVSEASTSKIEGGNVPFWGNVTVVLLPLLEQLLTPPTLSVIVGFFFGAVPWLKNLIIGDNAPLRVIQDSIKLLGDGTVPCLTLLLGGLRKASLKPIMIVAVICVRYVFLPLIGIGIVNVAGNLGFLPSDPLYRYVLLIQFAVPPAMNIGIMTQLFDVAQEECSVLFLWTYLVASLSLTIWSTIFMWILS